MISLAGISGGASQEFSMKVLSNSEQYWCATVSIPVSPQYFPKTLQCTLCMLLARASPWSIDTQMFLECCWAQFFAIGNRELSPKRPEGSTIANVLHLFVVLVRHWILLVHITISAAAGICKI